MSGKPNMDTTLVAEFLVVLVISLVFSMFGKGGGSLYTPILILFGLAVSAAVSTSLFLNLLVAFTAMIVFAWNKIVDYRIAAVFAPGTIAGSIMGVLVSRWVPTNVVLAILAIFLAFAGTRLILMGRKKADAKNTERRAIGIVVVVIIVLYSFLVGALSSLIGVGGGLIIFPFLVLYMRHNAQRAAGANALIVTISSLVGAVGHGIVGHLDLLVATAVAAVIGAAVGSQVTARSSSRFINAAFGILIWAFAIEIALSLLGVT
ncbi:MAG: sulfite exporter TauE/SafE family protein [Candidatus Bathyarchaeia archaeon]